jgi:hypothetical protein
VPLSFYEEAACLLSQSLREPKFFVFSTFVERVRSLRMPGEGCYLGHDNGYVGSIARLWLISRCRHHIISNSSFYWWGAWLAEREHPDCTVLACDQFPNGRSVPSRWSNLDHRSAGLRQNLDSAQ